MKNQRFLTILGFARFKNGPKDCGQIIKNRSRKSDGKIMKNHPKIIQKLTQKLTKITKKTI